MDFTLELIAIPALQRSPPLGAGPCGSDQGGQSRTKSLHLLGTQKCQIPATFDTMKIPCSRRYRAALRERFGQPAAG